MNDKFFVFILFKFTLLATLGPVGILYETIKSLISWKKKNNNKL